MSDPQLRLWSIPPQGAARKHDPETAKEAALSFSTVRLSEIQEDVMQWFRVVGRSTDEQLEDALHAKHPGFSTLRKRRTELVRMGKLRDSGNREQNRNGCRMIIWEVVNV